MADYLDQVEVQEPDFGDLYDELSLWSAPFGLLLLDRVPLKRGITVLDVGAGTGFTTLELAQRCGDDARVIAVDVWAGGLARLERQLAHRAIRNVETRFGDASELDLDDGTVDLIVCNLGLNNFDEPARVLAECRRVARPGAVIALTTNLAGHMREFYEVFRPILLGYVPECLSALDVHEAHRGSTESVIGLLDEAGFGAPEVAREEFRLRYVDGSAFLRHRFTRLAFLPAWQGLVPAGRRQEVFLTVERELNRVAARQGELVLSIPAAYVQAAAR